DQTSLVLAAPLEQRSAPCAISIPAVQKKLSEPDVEAISSSFAAEFLKAPIRGSHGRGGLQCSLTNEAAVRVKGFLESAVPGFTSKINGFDQYCGLNTFGFAHSCIKVSTENCNMGSLRYHMSGSKSVVMASWDDVRTFLGSSGIDPALLTPAKTAAAFKVLDDAKVRDFGLKHKLYCGTVGPHALLYTPANYITVERATGSVDVIGFMTRGLAKADSSALPSFDKLRSTFDAAKDAKQ
ncbi:unnamed protein product, partial [Prorocentrum cordatum]